jgi:hypothetical protein
MARRKRRRTKTSRAQRSAARRRLTLGDTVRVKDAVMDPDYAGYSIGGWSGEIIAFDTAAEVPLALIEWDEATQRERMDKQLRRRAARQGLSADQMWLALTDLERVEGGKGRQRPERPQRELMGEGLSAPWTPPSCGHTYPDVLRLRDEVRVDGTFVRLTDCRYCGRAELVFPASILAEELRLELEAMGSLPGIAEEEIEMVRQRDERRLRQRRRAGRWCQRLWWRFFVRTR